MSENILIPIKVTSEVPDGDEFGGGTVNQPTAIDRMSLEKSKES